MSAQLPQIETERLVLRMAESRDATAVVEYYHSNQEHLALWEPRRSPEFYTVAYWSRQAASRIQAYRADQGMALFLFPQDSPNRIIGAISFNNFVRGAAHMCHMGYGIGRESEGRGLMTEAARAGIEFTFKTLRMHRVMANYMPRNVRSERLLERLGFVREGIAKRYLLINGRWEDHVLTSLVNEDW